MTPEEIELERMLDAAFLAEQDSALQLSKAIQAKAEWDALVAELRALALREGREVALRAIPFLGSALRAALLAASV